MSTIGEQLREARMAKSRTTSQAAKDTRIKVQIIEDLEMNDFSRIAAPIYGKGFIKIYAEYLEINPDPLIAQYLAGSTGVKRHAMHDDDGPLGRSGWAPWWQGVTSAMAGKLAMLVTGGGGNDTVPRAHEEPTHAVIPPARPVSRTGNRQWIMATALMTLTLLVVVLAVSGVVRLLRQRSGDMLSARGRSTLNHAATLTHEPPEPYLD